ncbi:uncharacterized protein LOC121727996 [Aricia agestis]|uniref:uncharacterized protein LOC121727996 n=1 Tax=Aricia agestis TaxID=91739 RepID=UPI001C20B600|nr:uncharacterized protein LOC121727996 [Aricia agestis]
MRNKYQRCEICRRNTNVKEKHILARFPTDEERCKKWVKAVGIPELARLTIAQLHYSHFLCGKHFSDDNFRSKNTRLKITAIPTLHLINPPLSDTFLENFPGKKLMQLPEDAIVIRKIVTIHVENGVTTATTTQQFLDEHNYFQQIDPLKCDTSAQIDTGKEDNGSDSANKKENREEIKMETSSAPNAETDADIDDAEDYSAPISSSLVGISEDQNRKTMEINGVVLTWYSPDPTTSSAQLDVVNHSSNVTITNPGPTTSSVQSTVANHSSNVKKKQPVTKQDKGEIKRLKAALANHYRKKTALKLKEMKRKLRDIRKKLRAIESIESPLMKSFIESEISNSKKNAHGKRWSTFTKCVALGLYNTAPQAYTYLAKLLPLPTVKTIKTVFQEFQQEGVAVNALEQLQPQTEDFQAADTLVFPSADTIVERLPYEE